MSIEDQKQKVINMLEQYYKQLNKYDNSFSVPNLKQMEFSNVIEKWIDTLNLLDNLQDEHLIQGLRNIQKETDTLSDIINRTY